MTQGGLTELMGDIDGAINAYEQALRHNQYSIQAMNAISCILRTKENFPRAVEYLQAILKLDGTNGEVWGSLGEFIRRPGSECVVMILMLGQRALLLDDGRSPASIWCLSASSLSSTGSKGTFSLINSTASAYQQDRSQSFGMESAFSMIGTDLSNTPKRLFLK